MVNEKDNTVITEQDGGSFTPPKQQQLKEACYTGLCIKSFPKDIEQCQIIDILLESGLPDTYIEDVSFKTNGTVVIKNLEEEICSTMTLALHNKKLFGRNTTK